MFPIRLVSCLFGAFFCALFVASGSAFAAYQNNLNTVASHNPHCNLVFPCPSGLKDRIDFWIEVFSKWDTNQAIIHDSQQPHIVYKVVESKYGCSSSSKNSAVHRHKELIKKDLRQLSKKLAKKSKLTIQDRRLRSLFGYSDPDLLYEASNNIRCQQGNKSRFRDALYYHQKYRHTILSILNRHDLPSDLQYLPFVESGYNPIARSHAGALGMWQIMPTTGRKLGMTVNSTIDERYDIVLSTEAAAQYFLNSIETMQKEAKAHIGEHYFTHLMPFVITSYNYGIAGMRHALRDHGTDYLNVLENYKGKRFRTAVKNFYSSFIAARYVERHKKRYFPNLGSVRERRTRTVELKLPREVSASHLIQGTGLSKAELKEYNPVLTNNVWNGYKRIPAGFMLQVPFSNKNYRKLILNLPPEPKLESIVYKVRKGDSVCKIANRFGANCMHVLAANNLAKRSLIFVGQKLTVPLERGARVAKATGNELRYKVRRGDTGCEIAAEFGMTCEHLLVLNGLDHDSILQVGQLLHIPNAQTDLNSADATSVRAGQHMAHKVRRGQGACRIAQIYRIDCDRLLSFNGLTRRSVLQIGQSLQIPLGNKAVGQAASEGQAIASVQRAKSQQKNRSQQKKDLTPNKATLNAQLASDYFPAKEDNSLQTQSKADVSKETTHLLNQQANTSTDANAQSTPNFAKKLKQYFSSKDFDVHKVDSRQNKKGLTQYYISVLPEETLGHYAHWLKFSNTSKIRRINKMKRASVHTGQRIRLPIVNQSQRYTFEQARKSYHLSLVDELINNYQIQAQYYEVRRGDAMVKLARKHQLPLWLLMYANDVDLAVQNPQLQVGQKLTIPVLKPIGESSSIEL